MTQAVSLREGIYMEGFFSWKDKLNLKYLMIVFLLVGPLALIWGCVELAVNYQNTSRCSAEAMGQVVSVEKENRMTHKGSVYTLYFATVKPVDSNIFSTPELKSTKSSHAYEKDEYVRIKYDPSDHSRYIIEYSDPSTGSINLIIGGAALTFIGLLLLIVPKILEKK